jgi:hypothetical protein
VAATSVALWDAVSNVLKWSNWPGHSCAHTVNRLWAKNPFVKHPAALPVISREGFDVTRESWDLDRLWELVHLTQRTDFAPAATHHPIVVVRWEGAEYLVDGRRRICRWMREGDEGPHEVLVVHASESNPAMQANS